MNAQNVVSIQNANASNSCEPTDHAKGRCDCAAAAQLRDTMRERRPALRAVQRG